MPWIYSVSSSTPPSYTYNGLNTNNQHAAAIALPSNCAITQIKVYASGDGASVSTRLACWNTSANGGAVKAQSATFTMASGSRSVGGQAWNTKTVTATYLTAGTYLFGLYRNPSGGHIVGTTATGVGTGYRKDNTATFPSIASMTGTGYDTQNKEPYTGVFYITAPNAPSSLSVSRNSDTSQTISFTNNATSDQPYDSIKLYRYDNITGTYYLKATLSSSATNYTDTSTIANRYYKYKAFATNTAGNSSYSNEDDVNTTPSKPTSVVATRVLSNVQIAWVNPASNETTLTIQRKTSVDGITWTSYATLSSTIAVNSTSYTDSSPANYNKYQVRANTTNPTLSSAYTESNEVIIQQPPNAPTGLTPDSIGVNTDDDDFKLKWTHNTVDGSEQTKFSIQIREETGVYPKVIDNCKDYTTWTASSSTLSNGVTTASKIRRDTNIKYVDSDNTASWTGAYKTISALNLTVFDDSSASTTADLIVFIFYIEDISKHLNFGIKLGTSNSNNYNVNYTVSTTFTNGWNKIAVAKSAFTTAGTVNWNNITYLRVEGYTNANASTSPIVFESWYMVKVTPTYANYADTFFTPFIELTDTSNIREYLTDTFINGNTFKWKVKTWGNATTGGTFSDGSSNWSDEATFTSVSAAVTTIVSPTTTADYEYSQLILEWTYTQAESYVQTQYLTKLYDSNGTLLETISNSSIISSGDNDSVTFTTSLINNSTYTITLEVKDTNDIWSETEEIEFDTNFLAPTTPTFDLELDTTDGSIDITIVNPDVISEYTEISTQDTYIINDGVNNGVNYDGTGELLLQGDSTPDNKYILLDFDLSSIIGKTITNATLTLSRKTTLTPGIDSTVNYITTSWDETTITYTGIPTLDTTDYDDHTHVDGSDESWDITSLISDISDGTITDFEGLAIVPTVTDGSNDVFYDSSNTGLEPKIIVEITPENSEADYNRVYRSVDDGIYKLILDDVPLNTTVTDYIPTIGGNNKYYIEAVSTVPSISQSLISELDVLMTGVYFINGGNNFEDSVKIVGDVTLSEIRTQAQTLKQFEGRTYPVKYQGEYKNQDITFSCDLPFEYYDTLCNIIEYTGNIYFRGFRSRWFLCAITNSRFVKKDNYAYTFSCNIRRIESSD